MLSRILPLLALAVALNSAQAVKVAIHRDSLFKVTFLNDNPLEMKYKQEREVSMNYTLFEAAMPFAYRFDTVTFHFKTVTSVPEFPILKVRGHTQFGHPLERPTPKQVATQQPLTVRIPLQATYIGHAALVLHALEYSNSTSSIVKNIPNDPETNLHVNISQDEGVWGTVFIVSVSILLLISYVNLGAQLDTEHIEELIKSPRTIILGLIISIIIMPALTWPLGKWLLQDQMTYRVGAFIFACGPSATASTLWAVMLDADKELSVGLQIVSNLAALITMPAFLYLMELAVASEGSEYAIRVPYMRLIYALLFVLGALTLGRYAIGTNKRVQEISRKIFKPLTFGILLFIILFSSILYFHIYTMFSWTITLTTFLITIGTYLISGVLAHLVNRNRECSFAISIASTYKNSGIAFAVLLVAFNSPDRYIAFVPVLTQVLTTSLVLYIFYALYLLVNRIRRRGQPDPIQATSGDLEANLAQVQPSLSAGAPGKPAADSQPEVKGSRSGSTSSAKSAKSNAAGEESEEMVAMNVTDSVPGSPASLHGKSSRPEAGADKEKEEAEEREKSGEQEV